MNVTAAPTEREQRPTMLWLPRLIVAVTVAALVLVGVDAGGPLRSLTTAVVLLVVPGLAASLAMGPMSVEARTLVSLVGSTALLAAVSMVMALLGSWSPTTGLWICSLVAFALLLVPFIRAGRAGSDTVGRSGMAGDTNESAALASGATRDDHQDEGGNDDDR